MKRLKRLQPVVTYVTETENGAAKALADLAGQLQASQAKLVELQQFQSLYSAKLYQPEKAMTAQQLREYRVFLANIGHAIQNQQQKIEQIRQQFAAGQKAWQQAYCRKQGVQKIQAKLLKQRDKLEESANQREMDDRAARKWRS